MSGTRHYQANSNLTDMFPQICNFVFLLMKTNFNNTIIFSFLVGFCMLFRNFGQFFDVLEKL